MAGGDTYLTLYSHVRCMAEDDDLVGARASVLRERRETSEGSSRYDALLTVERELSHYIRSAEEDEEGGGGRPLGRRYDMDTVRDIINQELAEPQNEDGSKYLVAAKQAITTYIQEDEAERDEGWDERPE